MIPVFRPSIGEEEIRAVSAVLRSGWLGLGPKTAEFETAFAGYCGARHAIGMSSGTAALQLSLAALGISPGDEVLVPTVTFVSTPHVVEHLGARAVFVDVQPETLLMDLDDAEAKISARTRAIMPVHYGGRPCDLGRLRALCNERGLFLVEDAAHACGARWEGRPIGAQPSPCTCFSFHAVKNLTCGEGGMVTTDDDDLAKKLRELRWLGISRDTWDRSRKDQVYAWQYWVASLGYKAHLSDVAAALGLVQLGRLEAMNARRSELVERYREALAGLSWLTPAPPCEGAGRSSWHLFHVLTERRDDLIAHLKEHGIAPGVHYYPCHLHPYYQNREHRCPVAERVWKKLLTLPLYPDLGDEQVAEICAVVRSFGPYLEWKRGRIEGCGCVLREVESTDLEQLRAWRNDPRSRRWFFSSEEISAQRQSAWFNSYLRNESAILYLIESPAGETVGTIGLDHIDRVQGTAEMGRILVTPDQRRRGWGRKAIETLLEYCFSTAGLHRIYAEIQEENQASRAVFRACGFEEEGLMRGAYLLDGQRRNKILVAAVR